MRHSLSEKLEVIRIVEGSELSVLRTLKEIEISSRSERLNAKCERFRGAGRIPPVGAN